MTFRDAPTSAEAEVRRLASKLNRVRERSEGGEADWKATVNRYEAAEGRGGRAEAKRLRDSLGEAERQRPGITAELQGFRRAKDDFDQMMEDIEVQRFNRVQLVTSNINGGCRRWEAV